LVEIEDRAVGIFERVVEILFLGDAWLRVVRSRSASGQHQSQEYKHVREDEA
jgi:hypothetical protein